MDGTCPENSTNYKAHGSNQRACYELTLILSPRFVESRRSKLVSITKGLDKTYGNFQTTLKFILNHPNRPF